MKIAAILAVATAAATLAGAAAAQTFQKPEDAIKYRRASFTVLAAHYGPLVQMANGRIPFDAQAAARHGDVLAVAATLPWHAFPAGTDKGETRARAEIWSESAKFNGAADRMQTEVGKFAAAARTGNLDNLKAALGGAAPTCKACHDSFRRD